MLLTRENHSTWRKTHSSATFSPQNPTQTGLGMNLGICRGRPVTKHESWSSEDLCHESKHNFSTHQPAAYALQNDILAFLIKALNNYTTYSLFGGMSGFPRVAHHPTGCTEFEQRLTQKSLLQF
jgi:hypothetical protein